MEKEISRIFISTLFIIIMGLIMCYPMATAKAQDRCTEWVAKMESAKGDVQVCRAGETAWASVKANETYCPGDTVTILENSTAALRLPNEDPLHLDQGTTVTFDGIEKDGTSLLHIIKGIIHFFSRTPRSLKVTTAFVNGTVEGTEFLVEVASDHTLISVFQGNVLAANDIGSLNLTSGQAAIAYAGEAPKSHIVVRPRDALQWAIYYPAVIDYRPTDFPGEEAWQGMVRKSIQHYRDGDLAAAFSSLDSVPETIPDPRFYAYRAGLFLTVGRVVKASDDIEESLRADPTNSNAFALQSIIAVAQNRKDEALELASRAISLDPDSSAAKVALSYAYQASFQIQAALETLQEAVALSPDNALAWARLSELWMSVGDLDKALEAAQKGIDLNPNLARSQTVLGFAYLAQIKTKDAKAAFEKAIALDQASPLPRLGLGLAKIREGDLESGQADIEMAVCLDPNNSLMRSYLGKAFFDEKRDKHSDNQFALAKELDPNDPTPWFYDAIRKQTLNRPVEALQDLQKSIELNDNRAVYRSRLFLDEDLAARSASLGRIYSDLGFQQLALVEGWKSVNADPSNYSAHRFLADSYSALPRHEIARVSELLQSQLLQPINITPVQPSLAETDLRILEGAGPADPAFNEFNPLFLRNRLALQANGVVGGNNTLGGEVVQSGVWNRASYSVGAFHYETDGFRENNDLKKDIFNLFTQVSLSHRTSVQIEYRYKDNEHGDLFVLFDPTDYISTWREKEETHSMRVGARHALTPHSDLLGSFIYQSWDERLDWPSINETGADVEGYIGEIQHVFRSESYRLVSGMGYTTSAYDIGSEEYSLIITTMEDEIDHFNFYVYSLINYPNNVTWTLGGSAEFFDYESLSVSNMSSSPTYRKIDTDEFNPKLGLTWNPFPDTTIRAAVFRTLLRELPSRQTLEPTQVAGFNQFFDDAMGTETWLYGFGMDQKFSSEVYGGLEFSKRDIEFPFLDEDFQPQQADWEDDVGRVYLYWMPHRWVALSAEYQVEQLDRQKDSPGLGNEVELKTHRFPLGMSFFHPSGFSARIKATYIDQKGGFIEVVEPPPPGFPFITIVPKDDRFWMVDAAITYRLPNRWGLITLEAKNLFDEEFKYQDTDPSNPRISQGSLILARFTLAF
jgi:tetratricopeptide (TPR) repeat protein